ncbi:RNA-binding protein 4F [Scaptodrosophila lebanonensis]|uniref:RNA-binding protein 4F n=1 Tax=Drosophila lebanonensis TaxID=7225 RepID=A0A6J2TT67_DROLE|nr:RNA-binding protein 4F [Scaptodrosophila lebanonensis]
MDDSNPNMQQEQDLPGYSSADDSGSEAESLSSGDSDSSDSENNTTKSWEDEYDKIAGKPVKEFEDYAKMCRLALNLTDFTKLKASFAEFDEKYAIPSELWLHYLRKLILVTQTDKERKEFETWLIKAMKTYYDTKLSDLVLEYLMEKGSTDNSYFWSNVMADYSLECQHYFEKMRTFLKSITNQDECDIINALVRESCPNWDISSKESYAILDLVLICDDLVAKAQAQNNDKKWKKYYSTYLHKVREDPTINSRVKDGLNRTMFERLVATFPAADILWIGYIEYMQKNSTHDSIISKPSPASSEQKLGFLKNSPLELVKRALLAGPSIRLNHLYLHMMEQAGYTVEQIDEALQQIFPRITRQMVMTVELYLDYLAYRVRVLNSESEEQVTALRTSFQQVWDSLSLTYGDKADTNFEVLKLWAQVEYSHLKCPEQGNAIWRQILAYLSEAQLWLEYAQMETEYNGAAGTREILQEALELNLYNAHILEGYYRRFERCYGTYETIADCQARQATIARSSMFVTEHLHPQNRFKMANLKFSTPQQRNKQTDAKDKTRKHQTAAKDKTSKPQAAAKDKRPKPQVTAGLDNNPPKAQQPSKQSKIEKQPEAEPKVNFTYSVDMEENKIFIKNLHADCTEHELQNIFKDYGAIKDVRLVYNLRNVFKGFAYIEFEEAEHASKAVAGANGLSLGGKDIFVAISHPPQKRNSEKFEKPLAQKRRVQTSLIPTTFLRQDAAAKRRKMLDIEIETDKGKNNDGATASSSIVSNGGEGAKKTNDYFRQLLNK